MTATSTFHQPTVSTRSVSVVELGHGASALSLPNERKRGRGGSEAPAGPVLRGNVAFFRHEFYGVTAKELMRLRLELSESGLHEFAAAIPIRDDA